jgi:hypothetical protein
VSFLDGRHDLIMNRASNIRGGVVGDQVVKIGWARGSGWQVIRVIQNLGWNMALLAGEAKPLLSAVRYFTAVFFIGLRCRRRLVVLFTRV